jgi:hypothetical protein
MLLRVALLSSSQSTPVHPTCGNCKSQWREGRGEVKLEGRELERGRGGEGRERGYLFGGELCCCGTVCVKALL